MTKSTNWQMELLSCTMHCTAASRRGQSVSRLVYSDEKQTLFENVFSRVLSRMGKFPKQTRPTSLV